MEAAILLFVQQLRNPVTDPILSLFSILGNAGFIWIAMALFLLCRRQTRKAGVQMALCLLVSVLLCNLILKPLIARPRPYTQIEELTVLLTRFADLDAFSFPSGHTSCSFAGACSLAYSYGKKGRWAYLLAALVAFSRVYIGAHYLSDVLGGVLLGLLSAAVAIWLLRLIGEKMAEKKQ